MMLICAGFLLTLVSFLMVRRYRKPKTGSYGRTFDFSKMPKVRIGKKSDGA